MNEKPPWPNGAGVIVPRDWVLKTIWGILGLLAAVFGVVITTGFVLHAQQATTFEKVSNLDRTVSKIEAKLETLPPKQLGVNTQELAVLRTRFDDHLQSGERK